MLILGICGSPNKKGSTAAMIQKGLDECAKMGAETKMIYVTEALSDSKSPFCTNCSKPCEGKCLKETKMEKVKELMCKCDGMIVGSPVYFGTVSGQLKGFFDKLRCCRNDFSFTNKVAGALADGASQYGGEEQTMNAIRDILLVYGMTVVGNCDPSVGVGHGGAGFRATEEGKLEGELKVTALARRIYNVAKATESLRK